MKKEFISDLFEKFEESKNGRIEREKFKKTEKISMKESK